MRNISTKDNPGTLPINRYAQVQPTITPLDFSKIAEDGQDGARATAHHDNMHELLYTSGDVVSLASDSMHVWADSGIRTTQASLPRQRKQRPGYLNVTHSIL